jgi:beta-glucosidase-like glycosyl hydrolase
VADLVSRLNETEQIMQTWSIAPAIPALGINAYNWRSNCLHGWAASGGNWLPNETWTVFPEPMGMGATWDRDLVRGAGRITAVEGRALHNLGVQRFNGSSTEARGVNCFSPNVRGGLCFGCGTGPTWVG